MTVTALHSRTGIPLVGGFGPAMAALEALTRDLSAELAPHGVRVVGLRPQAMPATHTIRDAFEPRAAATGMTWAPWTTDVLTPAILESGGPHGGLQTPRSAGFVAGTGASHAGDQAVDALVV